MKDGGILSIYRKKLFSNDLKTGYKKAIRLHLYPVFKNFSLQGGAEDEIGIFSI